MITERGEPVTITMPAGEGKTIFTTSKTQLVDLDCVEFLDHCLGLSPFETTLMDTMALEAWQLVKERLEKQN